MEDIIVREGAFFPVGFWFELKGIFKLAWPTSLSILFHYFIQPVSLMFCGHLGKDELASVAMALSMIYIACISIGRGLAFGGDTFFSQTYGSANKTKTGVYLQKGLIFGVFCSLLIWSILINTEKFLLLIRQEPLVARMAQEYIDCFMPGALAYCWIFTLMRYLLCQNSVIPNLLICMASCAINAILHYLFIYQIKSGIRGSAIALALTYFLVLLLLVSYLYFSGIYKVTWLGWSRECLKDWAEFGKVASSSIFMTFIFWFCTEVGTFLAGLLSEADISAYSICFQVEGFAWIIPLGVGSACTARIGQYLGGRLPLGAVTTCRVAFTVTAFISVAMSLSCFLLRYYIPMAFTSNQDLILYTGSILPLVALFLLLEGFGGVGISIVRGTGRQSLGAVIIFISFYLFALPVGVPLMFVTYLKLSGLWWGYILGLAVQNVCLLAFVARMNWPAETEQAQIRAGVVQTPQQNASGIDVNYNRRDSQEEFFQRDSTEHESLLNPVNNPGVTDSNFADTELILQEESLIKLLLRRLPICLLFVAVFVLSICLRLFVPTKSEECQASELFNSTTTASPTPFTSSTATNLIATESNSVLFLFNKTLSTFNDSYANNTVPFCNSTITPLFTHENIDLKYKSPYLNFF